MADESVPLYRPGADLTCLTTATVTGKTFVNVSATRDATTGLIKVAPAGAGVAALGVAAYTATHVTGGTRCRVIAGSGTILPVTAGAAVTAGAEVEVGTGGKAITLASGRAVGKSLETGSTDADMMIRLY
jgi:hypothetical protein